MPSGIPLAGDLAQSRGEHDPQLGAPDVLAGGILVNAVENAPSCSGGKAILYCLNVVL